MSDRIVVSSSRDLIRGVAERWRESYQSLPESDWKFPVQAGLDALDLETASVTEVEDVIGNPSWTRQRCDVCEREVERWVRLGEEPDYESATVHVCAACLALAVEAIA